MNFWTDNDKFDFRGCMADRARELNHVENDEPERTEWPGGNPELAQIRAEADRDQRDLDRERRRRP